MADQMIFSYPNLDKSTVIVENDQWRVQLMGLTQEKARWLWDKVNQHPSVFSDVTAGDSDNFFRYVMQPNSVWLEWINKESDEIVGLAALLNVGDPFECQVEVLFFDRKPAEKVPLTKQVIEWVFDNFQFKRVIAYTPDNYHATRRMLRKLGFVHEGTKRQAVRIAGKWMDVHLFGMLREEALGYVVPIQSNTDARSNSWRRSESSRSSSRRTGERSARRSAEPVGLPGERAADSVDRKPFPAVIRPKP